MLHGRIKLYAESKINDSGKKTIFRGCKRARQSRKITVTFDGRSSFSLGMPRTAMTLMIALSMACGDGDAQPPNDPRRSESEADGSDSKKCIDADGDGFGRRCDEGPDCDDDDDTVFEGCATCFAEKEGCGCELDALPVECELSAEEAAKSSPLCKTGTRYCRDGRWTGCVGIASFAR